MAHPTINITDSPSVDCPNAAYNCIKYCFEATDFQTAIGTGAQFTIEKDPVIAGYAPGVEFTIAGQIFTTGTTNAYNEVNTAPTQTALQFVQNFEEALNKNNYIFTNFEISITGTTLTAKAREAGVVDNFVFDFSNFGTPPVSTNTQGTNNTYRENYRLAIEVWRRVTLLGGGVDDIKISSEAYTPDEDGNFCINLAGKIAPLLKSRYVMNLNQFLQGWVDDSIAGRFFIRYGDLYSDTVDECDVQLRNFETSDLFIAFAAAFQREFQQDKLDYVCEHNWMTNMPDFIEICETTEVALTIWLGDLSQPSPTTLELRAKFIFNYTDGTTSTATAPVIPPQDENLGKFRILPVGFSQTNFFKDAGKTIDYYEVRLEALDTASPPAVDYASQFFKVVPCCEGDVEFYFLNEYGGFDVILFSQIDAIELQQSNAVFESFIDCEEEETSRTGKDKINQIAGDVYTVTSKFPNEYKSRLWLREFLSSPEQFIKKTITGEPEIFTKVIVLSDSVRYYEKDNDTLLIQLSYILNEDLNLIRN